MARIATVKVIPKKFNYLPKMETSNTSKSHRMQLHSSPLSSFSGNTFELIFITLQFIASFSEHEM